MKLAMPALYSEQGNGVCSMLANGFVTRRRGGICATYSNKEAGKAKVVAKKINSHGHLRLVSGSRQSGRDRAQRYEREARRLGRLQV